LVAQQAIDIIALPAAAILTALLLLQFSERIRSAHESETSARLDAQETHRALEQASERLRVALSAAGIGIWEIDISSGALAVDDRCNAILGLPAGAGLDYGGFLRLVHDSDRQRVHDAVNHVISGEGEGACAIEYCLDDGGDAGPRWIRSTGRRLLDSGR